MRRKLLERNALIVTMDYLRTHPHATPRELWFQLYRADLPVKYDTYRRWLRKWANHTEQTNITRTRFQYTLANQPEQEQPTFFQLLTQADRYFQAR